MPFKKQMSFNRGFTDAAPKGQSGNCQYLNQEKTDQRFTNTYSIFLPPQCSHCAEPLKRLHIRTPDLGTPALPFIIFLSQSAQSA